MIINIFTIYFFKGVHTLLLRPPPYPCTQEYTLGGTSHPLPKAYVLYGWPLAQIINDPWLLQLGPWNHLSILTTEISSETNKISLSFPEMEIKVPYG